MIVINPILLEIGNNFKQAHTSEPDSVEAIALMVALLYRTDKEPYIMSLAEMVIEFEMPEKMAQKFHPFLKTQGHLLGQLENDRGYYGGTYQEVLDKLEYDWNFADVEFYEPDWTWSPDYAFPAFTFVVVERPQDPQAINYSTLKLSQS